jgi:hypothetical protein
MRGRRRRLTLRTLLATVTRPGWRAGERGFG